MFCTNCGKEIPDSSKFCKYCGSSVCNDTGDTGTKSRMKKKKPVWLIPIVVIVVLAALIITGIVVYSNSPGQKYSRQIALGERYLSELKYEEAVAAFTAALEIDPDDPTAMEELVEATLSWADELVSQGDTDRAIEVMETSFLVTEDDRLSEAIEAIRAKNSAKQTEDQEDSADEPDDHMVEKSEQVNPDNGTDRESDQKTAEERGQQITEEREQRTADEGEQEAADSEPAANAEISSDEYRDLEIGEGRTVISSGIMSASGEVSDRRIVNVYEYRFHVDASDFDFSSEESLLDGGGLFYYQVDKYDADGELIGSWFYYSDGSEETYLMR